MTTPTDTTSIRARLDAATGEELIQDTMHAIFEVAKRRGNLALTITEPILREMAESALSTSEQSRERLGAELDQAEKLCAHLQRQREASEQSLSSAMAAVGEANAALGEFFSTGTSVTNCLIHAGMDFDDRPVSCEKCATDIRNHLAHAIRVNKFLNGKVDKVKRALASPSTSPLIAEAK